MPATATKNKNGILPFLVLAGAAVGGFLLLKKSGESSGGDGNEDYYYGGSGYADSGLNSILNQLPTLTSTEKQPITVNVPSSNDGGILSSFLSAFTAKDSIDSGVGDNDSFGSNGFGLYDDGLNPTSASITSGSSSNSWLQVLHVPYYSEIPQTVDETFIGDVVPSSKGYSYGYEVKNYSGSVLGGQTVSQPANTTNSDQYSRSSSAQSYAASGALPYTIDSSWSAKPSYYAKQGQSLYNKNTGEAFAYAGTSLKSLQSYSGRESAAETAAKKAALKASISGDSGDSNT